MPERIQEILNRIIEWWKKFTSRQKALIISSVVVVVVAIGILVYVVTRPVMVELLTAEDATTANSVEELLKSNDIPYTRETSGGKYTYSVNEKDQADAQILLGTNQIQTEGYSIDDVLNGSFSTTEADKEKKYQVYLENKFEEQLETLGPVNSAQVTLSIPEDDGTLIAEEQESYAKVILDLTDANTIDDITTWSANIAKYMATGLGNDTTDHITIIDGDGNMLFAGGDETSVAATASSNQAAKTNAENAVASKVRETIASANSDGSVYDDVDVGVNLSMSFDDTQIQDYDYHLDDGRTEGYLDSRTTSKTESTSGSGGTPGTDSNDTTYVLDDNSSTSSSSSDVTEDFLPDETITTTNGEVGKVSYDESSISIVATSYVIYNEDQMKASGQLEDQSFDEFVAANSERQQIEADEAVITAVANATGIPTANISIIAYQVPMFQYSDSGRDLTDYLQIIIALLVFALLGFVVFRTFRTEKEEEAEEEVTVEDLLEQAQEEELEDIGVTEKSETRILIEKFVDENPEAVANLLRNWLNDDWS